MSYHLTMRGDFMFYIGPSPPWGRLIPLVLLSQKLAPMPDVRRFLKQGKVATVFSALACFAIFLFFLPENSMIYCVLAVFAVICICGIFINRLYFQKITELARNSALFTGAEGLPVKVRFIGFGLMDIFAQLGAADDASESLPVETAAVAAANKNPLYVPPIREIQGMLYTAGDESGELGIVSEDLILYGRPATKPELESRWYVAVLSMVGLLAFGAFMLCCFIILTVFQPKESLDVQFCVLSGSIILTSSLLIFLSALFLSKMIRNKRLLKPRGKN
jgi:hypothetical protein